MSRHAQYVSHLLQERLTGSNGASMTKASIDSLCQQLSFLHIPQMIGTLWQRDLVNHGVVRQSTTFQPPEALTTFDIAGDEENCNRNLQLLRKRKAMRIGIAIAIIKCQHQRCASIQSSLLRL